MSAQAFALRTAIGEVAVHASDPRVVEVHPELAFVELSGQVLPSKKTAQGVARRIRALDGWVDVVEALSGVPPQVPVDDALDALAAAWTAARVATGRSRSFPADGVEARGDDAGRQAGVEQGGELDRASVVEDADGVAIGQAARRYQSRLTCSRYAGFQSLV